MDPLLKKKFQKQLESIEKIAEQKNEEIEQANHDKYIYLYDLLVEFLKTQDILMYGGYAIHLLLKESIYKPYELPDIDVFCSQTPKLLKKLIAFYKKKGITVISAKEALHENTYKVYSEGLQILDITQVSKKDYQLLKKSSVSTSLGISTVSIHMLKYTLHLLSGTSYNAYRWTKVYERMLKLYEAYPIQEKCTFKLTDYYSSLPASVDTFIQHFIHKEELPSFGWDTVGMYLEKDRYYQKLLKTISGSPIRYVMYNGSIQVLAKLFLTEIKDPDVQISEIYEGDFFLPPYIALSYKRDKCVYLFETNTCLSTIDLTEKHLSIHSIITMFYAMYFSSQSKDLLCVLQLLSGQWLDRLLSKEKLFENFILTCYGKHEGIFTLRRHRELRQNKNKNIFKK